MRTLQLGILAAVVAGMVTLIGCESFRPNGPSLVDQHFGESVHKDTARQIENPSAGYENTGNPQIDPDTAAVVLDRYFEKQSQPSTPQQMPSIIQIDAN
jgi:hypothetical protein